jgi:hypothetical protein
MTTKKQADDITAQGDAPETDADDIYLPVCCGEFGVRQAARFRDLWETTWSHDRRGRDETSKEEMPTVTVDHAPDSGEDPPDR